MAHLPQGTLVAITGGKDIAEPGSGHRAPRHGPRQVRRHDPRAWRRPRRREDRGKLGREERRPPDRLQAGLGPPRSGRSVPPQRRAPEPPAEGRHRVPRLAASPRTSSTRRGSSASRSSASQHSPQRIAGRVVIPAARPVVSRFAADGVAAAPSTSRALRAALAASLRSACGACARRTAISPAGTSPFTSAIKCALSLRALPVARLRHSCWRSCGARRHFAPALPRRSRPPVAVMRPCGHPLRRRSFIQHVHPALAPIPYAQSARQTA